MQHHASAVECAVTLEGRSRFCVILSHIGVIVHVVQSHL